MNIIIYGSSITGGVNIYTKSLYLSLKKLGYKVYLLKGIKSIGQTISILPKFIFNKKGKFIFLTWGIYNFLPFPRKSQICFFHGFPALRAQSFFKVLILSASILFAKLRNLKCITISNYSKSILHDIFCLDTYVIHNSLPLFFYEKFHKNHNQMIKLEEKKIDIIYVGRVINIKIPFKVIEILELFTKQKKEICIIGKGDSSENYQKIYPSTNIQFMGNLEHNKIEKYLKSSKVFISCSESEPFGLVFIEALIQGCIIVCPRSGGALEIHNLLGSIADEFFIFYQNQIDLPIILDKAILKATKINQKLYKSNLKALRKKLLEIFSPIEHSKKIIDLIN